MAHCTLPFVDIKTKVPSQNSLLIQTLNLRKTQHSEQPDGPPYREGKKAISKGLENSVNNQTSMLILEVILGD